MFFSEYLGSALSVSFHQCSVLLFVYIVSYQKDKRALTGNLPKNMADYEILEHFVEK